jgi:hypothetical protein
MAFCSRHVRAPGLRSTIGIAACSGVVATVACFLLAQEHLFLDGGLILKHLATGEETQYYRAYLFLARLLAGSTRPLGLSLQDAGCLLSALLGGAAIGLTVLAVAWSGAGTRVALLLGAIAASAPAQVFHSTTVDKRTLTEFGAALVLAAAVRARVSGSKTSLLVLLAVSAAAVHLHYNVAVAALPAFAWLALGDPAVPAPDPRPPARTRIGAALAAGAACVASLLVPALLAPRAAGGESFVDHWSKKLLEVPVAKHVSYLPDLGVDLVLGLGVLLALGLTALRRPRARWVVLACVPAVALHLYGMELYESQQTVLPDSPGARGAYLLMILPVAALLSVPVASRLRGKRLAWLLAATMAVHGAVLVAWFRDRGESWPRVVRNVSAILPRLPAHDLPPMVVFRSIDYVFVAQAMIPAEVPYAPITSGQIVDFQAPREQWLPRARMLNRTTRELLARGGQVVVAPGVFATLRVRGAGAAVDQYLEGLERVPAPGAAGDGYAVLRLAGR